MEKRLSLLLHGAASADPARVREVMELRLMLEPEVAALAASRRTGEELARLGRVLTEQERAEDAAWADLDARFHMGIARITRNEVVWEMAAMLHDLLGESRAVPLRGPGRREHSLAGHARILEALEEGNPEAARQAMRAHLADVEEWLVEAAP